VKPPRGPSRRQPRGGWSVLAALLVLLAGCQAPAPIQRQPADGPPLRPPADLHRLPDPVPRREPPSSRGNPASYTVLGRTYRVMATAENYYAAGNASWYGRKFHGRPTSSGEPFDMFKLTAAHRSLPIPTYLKVTNLDNGRSTIVRVNDRGPFHADRIIDLSYAAAVKLGFADRGTARVRLESALPPLTAATPPPTGSSSRQALEAAAPPPAAPSAAPAAPSATPGRAIAALPPSRPMAPEPRAAAEERFVLQAGAFSKLAAADALGETLENLTGATAFVVQLSRDRLYRVRLGPVNGRGEAIRLQALIAAAQLGEALILPH